MADDDKTEKARASDRRQATVVFADISGFTALSQKMDPEDMADTMDSCFRVLEKVVVERGGTVDKFIGDCVMALFGAPKALEHAPRQAVNAAIEMRNALKRFNVDRKLPSPLDCHIGVNTGLVVAGDMGGDVKRDYTVMGPTVNLAARLEGKAENGQIFVGPTTHRQIARDFDFRAVEPLSLKGIDEPVQAYEVLSDDERVHDERVTDLAENLESPIVGRDAELAAIGEWTARLLDGDGGVLDVEGESGLGKSRVLAEALRRHGDASWRVLEGRSLSTGTTSSYLPFIDLVESLAETTAGATDADAQAALDRALVDLLGADEAEEVLPFVVCMLDRRPTPAQRARLKGIEGEALATMIHKSMRTLLVALASRQPLVLIFDDLHWADQSSIAMLEQLLPLCERHPILFVHAYRPDYDATSGRIAGVVREQYAVRHRHVGLEPLSARACMTLIRNVLGTDEFPEQIAGVIRSRAGGNPLYVEEVLRSLVDSGALERRGSRLVATTELRSVEIHGSIEEVLMARVDRLPPDARAVLQTASVIGRRFHRSVLEAVAPDDADVDAALALLTERHLLGRVTSRETANVKRRTLSLQEGYFFHNGLAQEMLYESLLKRTRRELHGRIAEAVEERFHDRLEDFHGLLAYHYTRAEQWEQAQPYLLEAARAASRSAASAEALHFFREAYRVYVAIHGDEGDAEIKADLEKNIAMALLNTGHLSESIDHFNAALKLYGEPVAETAWQMNVKAARDLPAVLWSLFRGSLGRPGKGGERDRDLFAVMYNRCRAQNIVDPERGFFDNLAAIRHLSHLDPQQVENAVGIFASSGTFFAFAGLPFGISRRFFDLTARLSAELEDSDRFQHRTMEFVLRFHEGDWSDEHDVEPALFEHGLRHGLLWNADVYLGMNCERNIRQGKFDAAERQIAELGALCDDWGYGFARSNQLAMTAALRIEQRRLDEALEAVERYHDLRSEDTLHLLALSWRGKTEALAGDVDAADRSLAAAEAVLARKGRFAPFYLAAFCTSRLRRDVERVERTLAAGEKIAGSLRKAATKHADVAAKLSLKMARERPEALRLGARLAWRLGDARRATKTWIEALSVAEAMGTRPEYARICRDLAAYLDDDATKAADVAGDDASTWRERARRGFEELDARWDLDRLESAPPAGVRAA